MATKTAKKKALPKTKKFNGKTYTKKACGTKAAAKKTAANHRKKGTKKVARVVKDPVTKKYCVYTRG